MIWQDDTLPIIALHSTKGNPEVVFTTLQMWMFAHIQYFEYFWWGIWIATLCVVIWKTGVKRQLSKS